MMNEGTVFLHKCCTRVKEAIGLIQDQSIPLEEIKNVDRLLNKIGDARILMIGEASHGTSIKGNFEGVKNNFNSFFVLTVPLYLYSFGM